MALATQCPHCGTMFRVASDQLKLRGGIVRCGACQEIFDGSATLVDLDKLPAKGPAADSPPLAPPAPPVDAAPVHASAAADDALPFTIIEPESGEPAAEALPVTPDFEDQPVYTLDFDHTFDPLGILPKVEPDEADAVPVPAAEPETAADTDIDPLSLVKPWSRPEEDAEAEPAPVDDAPAAM